RRLQLSLFRLDGAVQRFSVGASRPPRDPAFVTKLFHEKLAAAGDTIDPGYGFELIRLSALDTAPLEAEQTDLSGGRENVADMAHFADPVRARLGDTALERPAFVESHLPERAQRLETFAETGAKPGVKLGASARTVADPADARPPVERPIR